MRRQCQAVDQHPRWIRRRSAIACPGHPQMFDPTRRFHTVEASDWQDENKEAEP
ncbi:hypothetical protein PISMIDRAFT_686556 [Pisolithus microcarpus 441]|uniref:Uncharacterized protein n=1 Tax=Pisolithus microcarpus 441 TaxID=765257 RepID=A0A0C9Z8G5_9AGAM|nr:hypothetical protein PISMIDRAFT_686556 [Pisolithus microcarpus 441]